MANCVFGTSSLRRSIIAVMSLILVCNQDTPGQVRVVEMKDGKPVVVERPAASTAAKVEEKKPSSSSAKKKPGDDKKGDDKKDGDKDKDADKKEESGPVKRPTMSADKPSRAIKKEVTLSDDGVAFNLRGQSWESVLQWLADESKLSLDWQELPGDTLNLTTTRAYSLEEARDMLNRHLLSRGYTMLLRGELLSVYKLSEIKSSLVPRVKPEDLKDVLDHTMIKTSFDLDWLIADEALEELAPLLSKAGKISKMSRTNRLEIMDTAGTLKDIYEILQNEQSDSGQEQLVKTFRLKHRRANEVMTLLMDLLGMDRPPSSGGGSIGDTGQITSVMRQMTQQLQRMASSSSKGSGGGGGGREPTKTRLVLNQRENMILAQAMPDQMAIIEKAIEQIDVPNAMEDSLLQNMNKFKVYPLQTVDPQTLVDLLTELGDMAPGTVLNVNKDKKSIVAFATMADHLTITTLVDRLDSAGREVEVIPLRRLDAEYVAGTIRALMAPPPKEESNSRYSYFGRSSSSNTQPKNEKEFKVEPDIENNRLLVYANTIEMDEIRLLLQKLGEIPDPQAIDNGIRVFELSQDDDPRQVLKRLQQLWRGDNELQIDLPEATKASEPEAEDVKKKEKSTSKNTVTSVEADATSGRMSAPDFFAMLQKQSEERRNSIVNSAISKVDTDDAEIQSLNGLPERAAGSLSADSKRQHMLTFAEDDGAGKARPPVRFSLSPEGELIVTCDDKQALMEIEDLLAKLVRPVPNYKVFKMKYATPSWITLNLKDYFQADEETETSMSYDYFYGYRPSTKKKTGAATLGRRKQPIFIYDNFTSTILVRNADRKQLQVIQDLIDIYDVPEPADTRAQRITKIFKLKNSKADVVAQAVKDVFRDLLSANDKALEKKDGEKSQTRVYSYFGDDEGDDGESPIRFKGLLSIGMDTNSDTLVVSSTSALMDTVSELILELDKAAETNSLVQVVKVDPSVDIQLIQERLSKALGGSVGSKPKSSKGQSGQPQPNAGQNGRTIGR